MISYGRMYCISKMGNSIASYFANAFEENEKKDLINKTYTNGISMLNRLQGREPNQFERESTYRAAEEYVNSLLAKPTTRTTGHLSEITHPLLSIENSFLIVKRMSQIFKDVILCSVSNFDESAFQLCIVKNGTSLTVHQIGSELTQMGMETKRADAGLISSFFCIPLSLASEFVQICEPIDAEDMFFNVIAQTSHMNNVD